MSKKTIRAPMHMKWRFTGVIFGTTLFLVFGTLLFCRFASAQKLNPAARSMLSKIISQEGVSYPFTFAVLSDTHVGCERPDGACQPALGDCSCYDAFGALLDNITPYAPKFVIALGDLTHFSFAEVYKSYHDTALAWMNANQIPVFSIPGNHDFYPACNIFEEGGHKNYEDWMDDVRYKADFGSQTNHKYWDYYFDYGIVRFILVDNVQKVDDWNWKATAQVTSAQHDKIWIWLSTHPSTSFIFAHVPLAEGFPGYSTLDSYIKQYGTRAGFFGHKHEWRHEDEDQYFDGTDYFRVRAGCIRPEIASSSGWLLVTVYQTLTDTCGFWVEQHGFDGTSWTVDCKYPQNSLSLKGQTINTSLTYVSQEITVADPSQPLIIEGAGNLKLTVSDRILLSPGFEVRNGGEFRAKICTESGCD